MQRAQIVLFICSICSCLRLSQVKTLSEIGSSSNVGNQAEKSDAGMISHKFMAYKGVKKWSQ